MRALLHLLGAGLLLLGWAALVVLAVLAGRSGSWDLLAAYVVGAVGCLFLALLVIARFRALRRAPARRTPSHRA